MPHDQYGTEVRVGDLVNISARIIAIHLTKQYCNVDLEIVERMPPAMSINTLSLNAKQIVKVL